MDRLKLWDSKSGERYDIDRVESDINLLAITARSSSWCLLAELVVPSLPLLWVVWARSRWCSPSPFDIASAVSGSEFEPPSASRLWKQLRKVCALCSP